jgi:hypothetical protein
MKSVVPAAVNPPATDLRSENEAPTDLDWDAFRARYFPGRRARHDFQAVRAYGAYKQDCRELPNAGLPELTKAGTETGV